MSLGYCPSCGRTWEALGEAHCASCCSHFISDNAFEKHLAHPDATENCHDPYRMRDSEKRRVFEAVPRASGQAWKIRREDPHPFAGSALRRREEAPNTPSPAPKEPDGTPTPLSAVSGGA